MKYPWIVSLKDENYKHFCRGTFVASKYVISAAHCMFDEEGKPREKRNLNLEIGGDYVEGRRPANSPFDDTKLRPVYNYTNHPKYNYKPIVNELLNTNPYDITLIEIGRKGWIGKDADLTKHTPACMPFSLTGRIKFRSKHLWVYGKNNKLMFMI